MEQYADIVDRALFNNKKKQEAEVSSDKENEKENDSDKKKKKTENIFNQTLTTSFCKNCNEPISENICSECGYVENELVFDENNSTYDDSTRINVHKEFTYFNREKNKS
jgi:ribosomal protein L32